MKRRARPVLSWSILGILAAAIAANGCILDRPKPASAPRDGAPREGARMDWWRDARFGMFIHWGLYAIPAGEWGTDKGHGEWIMNTARIPVERYEEFRGQFNPVKFDADQWVSTARNAGMKYIVITTKHHDGFCLFDTKETEYDVMSTPFRKDIMKELARACRRQGIRLGWYHSIMDWHHPDYLPRRDWEKRSAQGADFDRYVRYLRAEVTELLTNYGEVDVMWFDGEWESTWKHSYGKELYELCRRLQPAVIVNNRVDVGREGMQGLTAQGDFVGDFGTPEQEIPPQGLPGIDWETCMTMNDHWGYNKNDQRFKTTEDLIRKLVDIASKGGNFLLNVGPTAEGLIPPTSVERLRAMGAWMAVNGEAIYGTSASPFPSLPWGRVTMKRAGGRTTLYLHVFQWPSDGSLVLPGIGNRPVGARLLGAPPGPPLATARAEADIRIQLPKEMPDPICTVVALEVEGAPLVYRMPTIEAPADIFVNTLEVTVGAGAPELEVRYTLDGSEPGEKSPAYKGPIRLSDSATLRARAFHQGKAVSPVAGRRFQMVPLWPARPVAKEDSQPGLVSIRYDGKWDKLPAFASLPVASFTTIPNIRFETIDGGPFARRYQGWLTAPESEVYELSLVSDDGARLRIDDKVVIDNDGLHPSVDKRGFVALAAGAHKFELEYFNGQGEKELTVRLGRPGKELQPVPDGAFEHVSSDLPEATQAPPGLEVGLVCEIYPGSFEAIPKLDERTPSSTTTVPNFTIEPGNPSNTARRFRGKLSVPSDDLYTFELGSDDGSRLTIDGKLVIDNDGLHPFETKRGSVALTPGFHSIVVEYFNRGGGAQLSVRFGKGSDKLRAIPDRWLGH